MTVLPGVLGCRTLRRTVEVRLGTNTLRLPDGTPIFVVSRQQFMKYPGYVAMSRGFYGAYHYGLRGLPFSPYHPYDLLRLFLFNRFIAFSCFSLLLSPLLK